MWSRQSERGFQPAEGAAVEQQGVLVGPRPDVDDLAQEDRVVAAVVDGGQASTRARPGRPACSGAPVCGPRMPSPRRRTRARRAGGRGRRSTGPPAPAGRTAPTPRRPSASRIASCIDASRSTQTSTSGGSSDTEVNEFAVMPRGLVAAGRHHRDAGGEAAEACRRSSLGSEAVPTGLGAAVRLAIADVSSPAGTRAARLQRPPDGVPRDRRSGSGPCAATRAPGSAGCRCSGRACTRSAAGPGRPAPRSPSRSRT